MSRRSIITAARKMGRAPTEGTKAIFAGSNVAGHRPHIDSGVLADYLQDAGDPRLFIVQRDNEYRNHPNGWSSGYAEHRRQLFGTDYPEPHGSETRVHLPDETEVRWQEERGAHGSIGYLSKIIGPDGVTHQAYLTPEEHAQLAAEYGNNPQQMSRRSITKAVRKYADQSTVASLLGQIGENYEHQVPNSNLRLVAADALDEVGREEEADLLRHGTQPVSVYGGKVMPSVANPHRENLARALKNWIRDRGGNPQVWTRGDVDRWMKQSTELGPHSLPYQAFLRHPNALVFASSTLSPSHLGVPVHYPETPDFAPTWREAGSEVHDNDRDVPNGFGGIIWNHNTQIGLHNLYHLQTPNEFREGGIWDKPPADAINQNKPQHMMRHTISRMTRSDPDNRPSPRKPKTKPRAVRPEDRCIQCGEPKGSGVSEFCSEECSRKFYEEPEKKSLRHSAARAVRAVRKYALGETTEDDFQRMLDANPDDHHTRLVFADWLQERNDPRAEGYRALGVLKQQPFGANGNLRYVGEHGFTHDENQIAKDRGYVGSLPRDWFDALGDPTSWWHIGPNRRAVEDSVALGFQKLPPERRQEILSGPHQMARYPEPESHAVEPTPSADDIRAAVEAQARRTGDDADDDSDAKMPPPAPVKLKRIANRVRRYNMTPEAEEAEFHRQLKQNPRNDHLTRGVYADWLADNGRPAYAEVVRGNGKPGWTTANHSDFGPIHPAFDRTVSYRPGDPDRTGKASALGNARLTTWINDESQPNSYFTIESWYPEAEVGDLLRRLRDEGVTVRAQDEQHQLALDFHLGQQSPDEPQSPQQMARAVRRMAYRQPQPFENVGFANNPPEPPDEPEEEPWETAMNWHGGQFSGLYRVGSGATDRESVEDALSETDQLRSTNHGNLNLERLHEWLTGIHNELPPEEDSGEPEQYAAWRAPAGGMIARGVYYKGGKMVPSMTGAFMNPPQPKEPTAKLDAKKKKPRKRKPKVKHIVAAPGTEGGTGTGMVACARKVKKFAYRHPEGPPPEPEPEDEPLLHEPAPLEPYGDDDRRLWVLNHEPLYLHWTQTWGADPNTDSPLEDGYIEANRDLIDDEIRRQPGMEDYPNRMARVAKQVKKYSVNERSLLERAINDNPLDAGAHLALSDWLQEHGETEESEFRKSIGNWLKSYRWEPLAKEHKGVRGVSFSGGPNLYLTAGGIYLHPDVRLPVGVDWNKMGLELGDEGDIQPVPPSFHRVGHWPALEKAFRKGFSSGSPQQMSRMASQVKKYAESSTDLAALLRRARSDPYDATLHGAIADALDEHAPGNKIADLIRRQYGLGQYGGQGEANNLWHDPFYAGYDNTHPYAARLGRHGPFDLYLLHEWAANHASSGGPSPNDRWVLRAMSRLPGSRDAGYNFEVPHEQAYEIPAMFPPASAHINPAEFPSDSRFPFMDVAEHRESEARKFDERMDEEERNRQ